MMNWRSFWSAPGTGALDRTDGNSSPHPAFWKAPPPCLRQIQSGAAPRTPRRWRATVGAPVETFPIRVDSCSFVVNPSCPFYENKTHLPSRHRHRKWRSFWSAPGTGALDRADGTHHRTESSRTRNLLAPAKSKAVLRPALHDAGAQPPKSPLAPFPFVSIHVHSWLPLNPLSPASLAHRLQNNVTNPAARKCPSFVNAFVKPSRRMTTNET